MQDPREPDEDAPSSPDEGNDEPGAETDSVGTEAAGPTEAARDTGTTGDTETTETAGATGATGVTEASGTAEGSATAPVRPAFRARVADRLRWNRRGWPALRNLSWRDLAPWRPSRFEPGPLGLLGVMLSAMAVTLLLVQTGSGGAEGTENGPADEPVTVPGPPEGELRVMVVGDSLTQGSSGDHTWRYHLWSHLREVDVEVDFVGPHDGLYGLEPGEFDNHDYADPDFDTDHAARWGATAGDLAAGTARTAAEYEPHYLLLLAGTEDILAGDGADSALEGIGETVSTVRVARGGTRFVVGELPPVEGTGEDGRINAEIDRFNMGLVDLAARLTSSDSPVVVARVADGYAPARDSWDGVHPNTRGGLRIAAAFADALADPLGVGQAYRRPLPNPEVGPLTAPEPAAEESEDGLVLSWEAVPGATDYRVVQRRVTPDPDEATVLPLDVRVDGDSRSVLVEGLFSGARYEFVVRSFKGRDEGVESEPLSWVWDDEPPPGPSWVRVLDGGATVEWEEVAEASHYEVWVRVLECSVADDRRPPSSATEDDPSDGPVDDPSAGSSEPPTPDPRPTPSPTPEPRPEPSEPDPVEPEPRCERRDAHGPEDGQGWRTLGSVGETTRWSATVSGAYEVVIRSYRDYVEGGYSDSVLLSEG